MEIPPIIPTSQEVIDTIASLKYYPKGIAAIWIPAIPDGQYTYTPRCLDTKNRQAFEKHARDYLSYGSTKYSVIFLANDIPEKGDTYTITFDCHTERGILAKDINTVLSKNEGQKLMSIILE